MVMLPDNNYFRWWNILVWLTQERGAIGWVSILRCKLDFGTILRIKIERKLLIMLLKVGSTYFKQKWIFGLLVLATLISMSKGRQGYQSYLGMSLFKYLNHRLYYACWVVLCFKNTRLKYIVNKIVNCEWEWQVVLQNLENPNLKLYLLMDIRHIGLTH